MKAIFLGVLLIVGLNPSFGQKKQKITIQPLSDVTVDADLQEWEELEDVAGEGMWFYQVAQDASNLYLAVRVENQRLQVMAAGQGILFSVLANNKKRNDIQFLFPYPDREVLRAMQQEVHTSPEVFKRTFIERSRGYFVRGFPTVPDGLLSFQNSYGLRAAARLDDGIIYYEAVIPKALLDYTAPVATLKLAINDGFTTLNPSNKRAAARPAGRYGAYRGGSAPRAKDKQTLTVLLETTIK